MSLTLTPTQTPLHRGYKRTSVGVIPEDWTIRTLLSCLRSAPNYGINAAAIPFDGALPTYLRITDIGEDNQFRPSPRVSVRHPSAQTFFLNKGDLVFARTGASVGKSYLYNPNDGPLVFAGFLIRVSPNPGELQPDFLAYYVQSKRYWNWVATVSIRSGQPGINGQEYGTLQLPLPGPAEQCAIATALSDVDALLGGLDRLIAKKRDLKQATMQQLLTGQTRLPGFDGEWETRRVVEIGTTYGGLTGKKKADFGVGHARYVTFLNVLENVVIDPHQCEPVCVDPGERQNPVHRGDILFNGTSETPDDLAMAAVTRIDEDNLFLNSFCFGFRAHDPSEHLPLFLAYYFRGSSGRHIMRALAQGATRYNMSKSQFMALALSLPPHDEQKAIATVLSDMDAEIAALEARRDKTRDLKQGMMQELLTGRIRLI